MKEKNKKIYQDINNEEAFLEPSYMGIIPSDQNFEISENYLRSVIEKNEEVELISIKGLDIEDMQQSFELVIEYKGESYTALVAKNVNDPEYLQSLSFANRVNHDYTEKALNAKHYIDISIMFQEDALESYFFQLKLMNTVVPEACLGLDFSAMTVFSPDWMKMLIAADTPPSPKYLYTIHAVYDGEEDNRVYWLHTHGLLRCGSMELEVVNLKRGVQDIYSMLNYAAGLFIQNHYKENESFTVGYDGLNMNLAWVKWEEALRKFPKSILGGLDERQDENDVHTGPSGVLFAVEEGNLVSPEIYADTLADNPIIYISNSETNRMRKLALSQLSVFNEAFEKYEKKVEKKGILSGLFKSKKETQNDWTFLVKLGLIVDNAKDDTEREHLWFDVINIDGDRVTAKLTNKPYWIAKLKNGETYTYPIKDVLTDWVIYSPEDTFSPDMAYLLKEVLSR